MGNDNIEINKDHGTKRKTPVQLQSLEKLYSEEKYPKQKTMNAYAASLKLTYNQIRIWFAERRRKERKENEVLGSIMNCFPENSALGQSGLKIQSKSKYTESVNPEPESDQFFEHDGASRAHDRFAGLTDRLPAPSKTNKKRLSHQGHMKAQTSSKNPESGRVKKNYFAQHTNKHHIGQKIRHKIRGQQQQVILSPDYILKRVFRKDGPPLGVEFDPIPARELGYHTGLKRLIHSCQESERIRKRRKVVESHMLDSRSLHRKTAPAKKYGIGKGLMTVWRATNSDSGKFPAGVNFIDKRAAWLSFKHNVIAKGTLRQDSKRLQQRKLVPKQRTLQNKVHEKRKPLIKKRKVLCHKNVIQKKPHPTECILSIDEHISQEHSNALTLLVDDEELELGELQAGPNPLRCSAHLASNGMHGCPLCKDLLARFPPQTIKMKQPLCRRPWDSSPEFVKKLFKVFRFLYTHSTIIEVCPFTLDEFVQAFHEKDSLLLGKVHVALLKLLLLDVEREITAGFIPRAYKDCRFMGFLHFVREQEFDVNFWRRSLNPLTWTEILRQVMVAAGFGSKENIVRRENLSKERNRMTKYGLRPRTLKGELFSILSEKGTGGLNVSELAKASQIVVLDLANKIDELEQLICLTLSSDITLFEKIAPSVYRLRVNPQIKGIEDSRLDTEDSGSVDDDSGDASTSSDSDDSDDSDDLNSPTCERRIIKYKTRHKTTAKKLTEYTEIDESYAGEAWVLGLMEGEYSSLGIEEKLDTLVALIDLTGAGSSLSMEEPVRAISAIIPHMGYHGSGAKIKKSSTNRHNLSKPFWDGAVHGVEEVTDSSIYSFPIDSCAVASKASKQGKTIYKSGYEGAGGRTNKTEATVESRPDIHPLKSIYLGSDRRYNSYWLFLGPCSESDPGHRRVYFESSEDGHWEVIETAEALCALLSVLDCRGTREARLFTSLEKRETFLCQAMDEYMSAETESRQTRRADPSNTDFSSGDSSSPISDIDNIVIPAESTSHLITSGAIVIEHGKNGEEKKQKWESLQAFDKWIWNSFFSSLNAVRFSKRSYMESLTRCESCHDLYWRDEKHCKICHTTFEVDFDLEERYAIHRATCRETEDNSMFPKHKILPSQLQALKAAIHAIEAGMPEAALIDAWARSTHNLWVKRLRRTSSLPELLQVLGDFVGAINEDWLYGCTYVSGSSTALDEIIVSFHTMPQTTSAVALWMVKLDILIAPRLERCRSEKPPGNVPQVKGRQRRACNL